MEAVIGKAFGEDVRFANKSLEAKEWFAQKAFIEKRGSGMFDNHIFAVIKESEKAIYALLGGIGAHCFTWIPKSCVVECEEGQDTYICESYEEAADLFRKTKNFYN